MGSPREKKELLGSCSLLFHTVELTIKLCIILGFGGYKSHHWKILGGMGQKRCVDTDNFVTFEAKKIRVA